MIYIYPYNWGSRSVRNLRNNAPDVRLIRRRNSRFNPPCGLAIVNWGNRGRLPRRIMERCDILNHPMDVDIASNKRYFFEEVSRHNNLPIPRWATRKRDITWDAPTVVRHRLRGHDGQGVEILENHDHIPDAPLYVQYIKKSEEYRIHVFGNQVIRVQQKKRSQREENPNWRIRNHDNGFIFTVHDVDDLSEHIKEQSVRLLQDLDLDFGAIDMIWNSHYQQHYFLEVNTAPGLEGTVLYDYINAFRG